MITEQGGALLELVGTQEYSLTGRENDGLGDRGSQTLPLLFSYFQSTANFFLNFEYIFTHQSIAMITNHLYLSFISLSL